MDSILCIGEVAATPAKERKKTKQKTHSFFSFSPFKKKKLKGGAEHAVLHLLYARFWHKVLFDLGVVPTDEPFRRLVSQGMILGEVEYTARRHAASGSWCNEEENEESISSSSSSSSEIVRIDPADAVKSATSPTGLALASDPSIHVSARAHKMSKSRGNVVNPDDVVLEFGADSLRLYEMFMGPLRETKVSG